MAMTPEAKVKIECKAGKNKPTPLQDKNLREIRVAGGCAVVINEWTVGDLTDTLNIRVPNG